MAFGGAGHGGIRVVGQSSSATDQRGTFAEPGLGESQKGDPLKRLSTISGASNTSSESFFKKSEFLDPLVRITQMKFMTSADIHIAHNVRFACLDLRVRKVPRLTEIFKQPVMFRLEQQ